MLTLEEEETRTKAKRRSNTQENEKQPQAYVTHENLGTEEAMAGFSRNGEC